MGLLDLPMDATRRDSIIGYDEFGRAVRKGVLGVGYMQGAAPKPSMTMDQFWQQSQNLRQPQRQQADIGQAVQMLTSGLTAPGRALAGEPVTYGDVWDTAGTAALGGAAIPGPDGAMMANSFRAYHGSPHSFDKFSMDKIGTGEGAQAYGHGLYFADSEGVARSYRDGMSPWKVSGTDLSIPDDSALKMTGGDIDAAIAARRADIAGLRDGSRLRGKYTADLEYLEGLKRQGASVEKGGSMYEVQINADPDTFLDFDAHASKQPEAFKKIAERRLGELPDQTASGVLQWLDGAIAKEAGQYPPTSGFTPQLTEELRQAGIPGIKYLDAGSRTAGDGSRNYVVFDDSLIEILRKYGLAGLGVGGAAMMQPQQAQAGLLPRTLPMALTGPQ